MALPFLVIFPWIFDLLLPTAKDNEAYAFLKSGSSNTTFLRKNGISVIYTRVYDGAQNRNIEYSSNNPDLIEVAKNVYLLKEAENR